MISSKYFPSSSVINWYIEAEKMLIEVLNFLPYCNEHKKVWSPKFITILNESCSLLDSLWRYEVNPTCNKLTIKDYCTYFRDRMRPKWLIFWGVRAEKIQPFKSWCAKKPAESLKWWQTYQDIKHNRIENYNKATLENTVNALAALFLSILRCDKCNDALEQTNWISHSDTCHNAITCLSDAYDCKNSSKFRNHDCVAAETKLFSYAVGWSYGHKPNRIWLGIDTSFRFRNWLNQSTW